MSDAKSTDARAGIPDAEDPASRPGGDALPVAVEVPAESLGPTAEPAPVISIDTGKPIEAPLPVPEPDVAPFRVSRIIKGGMDQRGLKIEEVYSIRDPLYAVYKAEGGTVMVQYADDKAAQVEQRTSLRALSRERQELDSLADGWRNSARYHRELGLALVDALEGNKDIAECKINDAIAELQALRLRAGRLQYALFTGVWAALSLAALWLLASQFHRFAVQENIFLAGKAGVVGAFMSSAFALRGRTVAPNNDWLGNGMDTGLRIAIGMIGSGFLLTAFGSGYLPKLSYGDMNLTGSLANWQAVATLGFVGGFVERLVPSILDKPAALAK